LSEGTTQGPVLLANPVLNQIIVSGTAKEVAEVRSIAEELDARYVPVQSGRRAGTVIIPMREDEQRRLEPALGDLLKSQGLNNDFDVKNNFNVIRPKQRKGLDERMRREKLQDSMDNHGEKDLFNEVLNGRRSSGRRSDNGRSNDGVQLKRSVGRFGASLQKKPASVLHRASALVFLALGADKVNLVSSMMLCQQVGETETSNDSPVENKNNSVPGAPIEFRFTEYGLTVESEDLDAVDDIQAAIADFLGESTEVQLPSFFELQHRNVSEMQQLLESILGLSDAGGGGGGDGGGNPLAGVVSNVLPGGDLFDGLLGGGGGDDIASGLEGEVNFGADVRFNTLWVTGATANDLSIINDLVDYWDRPQGETKPELFGKTRMIKVYHRGVVDLVDQIKRQFPEMIYNEQAAPKQGAQGGEVAQAVKALQQLNGGKGGGGGKSSGTGAKQTVVLNADTANSLILVTGPQYMYDEILNFVKIVDIEPRPLKTVIASNVPEAVYKAVLQNFGGKVVEAGQETSSSTPDTGTSQQSSQAQSSARNQVQQQLQRAISDAASQGGRGGGGGLGGRGGPVVVEVPVVVEAPVDEVVANSRW